MFVLDAIMNWLLQHSQVINKLLALLSLFCSISMTRTWRSFVQVSPVANANAILLFILFPVQNDSGLNRYRIGDVLQVTGFHNKTPQFRFICRRNVVLSIDNDKTNEEDLHKSITVAKRLLEPQNALLVEYTSYADTSSVPGHYVIYWEIKLIENKAAPLNADLLQECCITIEEELDYIYRRCRAHDKSIGPLEIRVVRLGTFESLMDLSIEQGGSINQYKTPRCIKSNVALNLLDANVKACFFSPRDPTWIP